MVATTRLTKHGYSSPDVTLRVYAHLFRRDDDKAAAAINAALAGAAGS
jgi:integrase